MTDTLPRSARSAMPLSKRIENMFSFLYSEPDGSLCHFDKDFLDEVKAAALRGANDSLSERTVLDEALRRCAQYHRDDAMLDAPCLFCGYNGAGYWQAGTHAAGCRWRNVGGFAERDAALKNAAPQGDGSPSPQNGEALGANPLPPAVSAPVRGDKQQHVCGLQGFGAVGDSCPACIRDCPCADPENCTQTVPGYRCRKQSRVTNEQIGTPRTDALKDYSGDWVRAFTEMSALARQLERELAAEQRDHIQAMKDLVAENERLRSSTSNRPALPMAYGFMRDGQSIRLFYEDHAEFTAAMEAIAAWMREDADTGAISATAAWQPMHTAPLDGTEIEILVRHRTYWQALKAGMKEEAETRWQGVVRGKWIDHNGGGWTWDGGAGSPMGWRPLAADRRES